MSLSPEHLFALAGELDAQARHMNNPSEAGLRDAKFRCAISRAYYAVFWCGRRYFETQQPPQIIPRADAHYELRQLFLRYPGRSMKSIALRLKELKEAREKADYATTGLRWERESAAALQLANRLLNDIGALPNDPTQAP